MGIWKLGSRGDVMRQEDVKSIRDYLVNNVIPQFDDGKTSVYVPVDEFPNCVSHARCMRHTHFSWWV